MNSKTNSRRGTPCAVLGVLLALPITPGAIAQEHKDPVDVGLREEVRVRMTIVDVVVLDRKRRTVPGLTAADFEITVHGDEVPVASLDVDCPGGHAADPSGAYLASDDRRQLAPPGARKIVLALDYQHLDQLQRTEVLRRAKTMIEHSATANDEIMVVALTGGLRVEQPFSSDRQRTLGTLHRMEYDLTLLNGNFFHQSETGFLDGMTALFDVLGEIPGAKAAVLFSAMQDVPLDSQFRRIAALAAGSRCSIYPVDVRGLTTAEHRPLSRTDVDRRAVHDRKDTGLDGAERRPADRPTEPAQSG